MAAEPKTKPTQASVTAFLQTIADAKKRADAEAMDQMLREITGEAPVLWGPSIIGYGAYQSRSGPWPRIGFSPRKANLVIYLIDGYEERTEDLAQLGMHKIGKSCLYLNKLADVDLAVLRRLMAASFAEMAARYP